MKSGFLVWILGIPYDREHVNKSKFVGEDCELSFEQVEFEVYIGQ